MDTLYQIKTTIKSSKPPIWRRFVVPDSISLHSLHKVLQVLFRWERLLGIKGYYTNLRKEADKTIIDQYHSLWHVEQAFSIAKSDLAARPIYHFKRQTIEAHMLICFMALAVAKHMELKTKKSIKQIVQILQSITEARIRNKLTGEVVVFREELSDEVEQLWKTLSKS